MSTGGDGQDDDGGTPAGTEEVRQARLAEYRRLTREELPAAARAGRWRLRADHCFMRVVLDHLFGGCWYDHLDRRRGPAESQLSSAQLARAVALARELLGGGDETVRRMNARSLAWRGKG